MNNSKETLSKLLSF